MNSRLSVVLCTEIVICFLYATTSISYVKLWLLFFEFKIRALVYRGADKSLAHPTSPCILFDVDNI